ncbi:MAG TPA: ArsR family transcriptional regulator [Solirubrobacterales bacterium]|nr:ArsR family transcriptional regulator [Solirubrobacterales bacterium]
MTTRSKVRPRTLEETQVFAIGHEIRIEALTIFNERVASPKDVSETLDISLNKAGHHVKILLDEGCIELVRIEPRGGSIEHFYRGVKRPELTDEEWRATPDETRRKLVATVFRNLIAEGLSSIRAGKMSSDRLMRLSWKAMNLDAQGRREAADEQRESLERLQKIETNAAKRMSRTGESGISTVIAVVGFRRSRNVQDAVDAATPGEV